MLLMLTRRDLFHSTAMLAATLASRRMLAQTGAPQPLRLGIASYSLRNFDPAFVISAARQLRTPFLNLKDVHLPMTPTGEIAPKAALYRAAGLHLTAAGTIPFNKDDDDDIRAKFEYAKTAGIPLIVGAPTHATLPRLESFIKHYNIPVAIHNHGPEDKDWPSPLDVLAAVQNLDSRLGCCIDVGHTLRSGTDVVEAIHKAGPRLFDLHMKDLADSTAKESQVAVGEGVMPVRAIFEALLAVHYKGFIDLEYEINPTNPLPGMLQSFAYMRGVLAGMGQATIT